MHQGVVDPQYLYCFFRGAEPQSFLSHGMGECGDRVASLHYRDLGAVVSSSPKAEYDSSRRNMMDHTKVQEEVMENHSILPVRFNTISPDKETVHGLLRDRYDELIGHLDRMQGKIEMGLKALWYERVVLDQILAERADIRHLRDSLLGQSPDRTYHDRIRLSEMVEVAIRQKRQDDEEAILACVLPLAVEMQKNDTYGEHMVLNAAFLIERAREPAFDAAIHELDKQMNGRMLFRYVGPVPPYNFVNIVIHWNWLGYLLTFPPGLPVKDAPSTAHTLADGAEVGFGEDESVHLALHELQIRLAAGEIDVGIFEAEEGQLLTRLQQIRESNATNAE